MFFDAICGTVRLTFSCFASFLNRRRRLSHFLMYLTNALNILKAGVDITGNKKILDVCVSTPKTAPADSIYYYDLQ